MSASTFELPHCAGRCSCPHTFGLSVMRESTSSGKSFGCGDVNRMRT